MTRRGYGAWPSPIDADAVTAGSRGYGTLAAHGEALFWIESRPEEGGRGTLIRHEGGKSRELTPVPFNPRSSVHEYGGGAYCVADGVVYFVNFADQDIYAVTIGDLGVRRITADTSRYADLAPAGKRPAGRSRAAPPSRCRTGQRPGPDRYRDRDGNRPARRPRLLRRTAT